MSTHLRKLDVERELRQYAPQLREETFHVLADMYSATELRGTASEQPVPIDEWTRVSIAQGAQMNSIIRANKVKSSFEIGFAFGFSTIWILDALQEDGFHRAIDPFEESFYRGVGLKQVERLHYAKERFGWIADYSIHAMSEMIKQEQEVDHIFIDGSHRFDDVVVDFVLADQILRCGGVLCFDDLWMPSVRTVISFITSNREYDLRHQPIKNMAALMKRAPDNRAWDHFKPFKVHNTAWS